MTTDAGETMSDTPRTSELRSKHHRDSGMPIYKAYVQMADLAAELERELRAKRPEELPSGDGEESIRSDEREAVMKVVRRNVQSSHGLRLDQKVTADAEERKEARRKP